MKPTLFLLAAGMGSRYGGLKQLDGVGPNGETIMDYSIFDAVKAGFGKIVWVIRKDFEQQFKDQVLARYHGKVECELCFQSIEDLPAGIKCPQNRTKPWGTNHAVLMGKNVIKEPFCVINCDDFYNRDAFMVMGKFLSELPDNSEGHYAMVGFHVSNTLSENGSVSRGICSVDENGNLTECIECTKVARVGETVAYRKDNLEDGEWIQIHDNTPVSMNMWGFTPDYFSFSEQYFIRFLSEPKNLSNLKSEFYIPLLINELVKKGKASCKVLDTSSKWFGVTYSEDRPKTVQCIKKLVDEGVYPQRLFD